MSYSISLVDDVGDIVIVPSHEEGATYPMGGSVFATVDVTYNYSKFYYELIDEELGIRWLYGKTAGTCIVLLEHAINILGVYRDDDYWAPTPGNAGYALSILVDWARRHEEAVFKGD